MATDSQCLDYLIHHLFLPPQLPQENDWTRSRYTEITRLVLKSMQSFKNHITDVNILSVWNALDRMVRQMADTRTGPALNEHTLKDAIDAMQPKDVLCLHIVAQNAGVILRCSDDGNTILVEIFQASPPAAKVTSTIGKLIMTFPSMPRLSFPKNEQCITPFCRVLAWLDRTEFDDALAKTRKAGSEVNESREVADIHYVSQMLGGILATGTTSNLDNTQNATVYVTKRINDHVLWSNAKLPWRRMPEWLILRVALQTSLEVSGIDINSQFGYKSFITYLLTTVLREACSFGINHELLHVMKVKIAGRMWKLRDTVTNGPVFDVIYEQVKQCQYILQERWDEILYKERSPLQFSPPSVDDIENACHFTFPNCGDYLSKLYNRQSTLNVDAEFDPAYFEKDLRPNLTRNDGDSLPNLTPLKGSLESFEFWLAFIEFERWVIDKMQQWQEDIDIEPGKRIETLNGYLETFIGLANSAKNPELFSRLYLVVMELWVALDQAVIQISPLLQDYSPEIAVESFEPLLLPQLSQMKRLHRVEQYVQNRHARVRHSASIFNLSSEETCFASQYYLKDENMQNLRDKIRESASAERDRKAQKWKTLRHEFQNLTSQSDSLSHDYDTDWRGFSRHLEYWCKKCTLKNKASSLFVEVYEWPLPEDRILERVVVFELSPPKWFTVWRTVTYDISRIQSGAQAYGDGPTVILGNYDPLARYSTVDPNRITIAADGAKPWYKTHYSGTKVEQAYLEADVIKRHPLRYQLYDPKRQIWITSFPKVSLRDVCTPTLPSGVYSNLSWLVHSTTHTSNMVIAKQSDCPRSLTYHEWASFGHLRAGGRLQWRNILIEFLKGVGTFKDPAWFILLRQAAWQVERQGSNEYRDFHTDLTDKSFAMEALEVLSRHFDSIRENWQEGWTAMSLAMLTCRIHSLNNDADVRQKILKLLCRLRKTCASWLGDVRNSYLRENSVTNKQDLLFRLLQIAICCRSTYALEQEELDALFTGDPDAVKIFVISSIAIQDFLPGSFSNLPSTLQYIIQKDLVQAAEVFVYLMSKLERIQTKDSEPDFSGFENAIRVYWESFLSKPDSWRILQGCWLCCRTAVANENDQSRWMYYNVLDGQLLIDGKKLGGLPRSILLSPLYKWIFPNRPVVEIVPSTLKGMSYQLAHNVDGTFEVHFEENRGEVIIRVRENKNNGAISEFVDNNKLHGDFPNKVLHDTIILYRDVTENSLIFFEKLSADWGAENNPLWEMKFSGDPLLQSPSPKLTSPSYHTRDSSKRQVILSPRSKLVQDLFSIFNRLECSSVELCVLWESNGACRPRCSTSRVLITLPRYLLTFFLNSSQQLECKEMPNMIVAGTQSVGTLIGLQNQLILEDARYSVNKKVLIPYGDVNCCQRDKEQTRCFIRPTVDDNHIRLFVYELDHVIQRLTSTETLASFYYLVYLHAMTSYHMPDPLTGRGGTEQAVWMLKSNASFAFMEPLKDVEWKILKEKLLGIVPERAYYPRHLKSMETTTWRTDLPILAQSDIFVSLVDAIMEHNKDLKMFLDNHEPSKLGSSDSLCLRRRSQARTSRITTPEFYIQEKDEIYEVPLRSPELEPNQKRLTQMVTSINRRAPSFRTPKLWSIFCEIGSFEASAKDLSFSEVDDLFTQSISPNDVWFMLFYQCCQNPKHDYDLLFTFGVMAYRSERNMDILYLLLTIALHAGTRGPEFHRISQLAELPRSVNFTPSEEGYWICKDQLLALITVCDFRAGQLMRKPAENKRDYSDRCRADYHDTCTRQKRQFVDFVASNSTLSSPSFPPLEIAYPLDHSSSREKIEEKFRSWARNKILYDYCSKMDELFRQITKLPAPVGSDILWLPERFAQNVSKLPRFGLPTLLSLMKDREPSYLDKHLEKANQISDISTPRDLVETLRSLAAPERLLQVYSDDLVKCIDALEANKSRREASLDVIQRILGPEQCPSTELLSYAGQWPVIHPTSLLRQLTYPSRKTVEHIWLTILSEFGEGLRRRQNKDRQEQFRDSSRNIAGESHKNQEWKSLEYLDWLLLELEADISIRQVQVNIAKQMMSPAGGTNTVMQLNMGEGKSSVIIPMVSMTLANGEQLIRVMVLKPLSAQMFALLRQRVSGLANRRLYFLPFHRNVQLDATKAERIFSLFRNCAENAGILLCQPEHVLSFRLIGLERLCSFKKYETLLHTQHWLDQNSRDILDESDELLSTRYQLIYTIGTPLPLDGRPHRWEITQRIFSLTHDILVNQQAEYESESEVSDTSEVGRFRRIRLLTNECAQRLVTQLAYEIIYKERLPWLLLRNYDLQHREDAVDFITNPAVDKTQYDKVRCAFPHNFPHLLLLRGLLALGILVNVLKEKRWRVDYGLDLSRCLVAVPYRAKDYPSLRAEFGHPEVIIALTCLSYYYGGLRDEELKRVFEILLQLDNPDLYYQDWIKEQVDEIPGHLRALRGLNLEDAKQQQTIIFPKLRYIKSVIDFYLSHEVFPREAKEFPHKLVTNSWDLAMEKPRVTTGFSGTNDHRYLLPLSIKQHDSPDQKHTNALVLGYILRPENRRVIGTGNVPSATTLLQLVVQHKSQILIDAGAQVLELGNSEVARQWLDLEKRKNVEAAIYCDPKDEVFKVISRTGRIETLQNSPYKTQLEKTLVYLDEARTRGTDFKFPMNSVAVVTLGPKLVKDKLMQACMRMRQLGRGHSIMFFASDEIIRKINALSPDVDPGQLDSRHVLLWSLHETFLHLKYDIQHWGIQGLNYSGRHEAWRKFSAFGSVEELSAAIKEKEAKTLEELYGFDRDSAVDKLDDPYFCKIVQRSQEYGVSLSANNNIAEEQERELSQEKEETREVERALKVEAAKHAVDPVLRDFLNTGQPNIRGFKTLIDALGHTSSVSNLKEVTVSFFQSSEIRCTKDFIVTIQLSPRPERGVMDDFLRPVQWIMTSTRAPNFLCVISPYEANELLPKVRNSNFMRLHCYTARISRQGQSTESLDRFLLSKSERNGVTAGIYWTPMMIQELNIFSGQLFFKNQDAYKLVCRILGIHFGDVPSDLEERKKGNIEVTGFVRDLDLRRHLGMTDCKFTGDPILFLRDLFSWRCKGQGYSMTHIWKLLHGRNVEKNEF